MKKITLIISMVALFSLQGYSQQKKVSFGLKIGPTFDWVSSNSTASRNLGTRLGFNIGGIIDYYYTEHIALSTGLNYNYWRGYYQFTDSRRGTLFLEPRGNKTEGDGPGQGDQAEGWWKARTLSEKDLLPPAKQLPWCRILFMP